MKSTVCPNGWQASTEVVLVLGLGYLHRDNAWKDSLGPHWDIVVSSLNGIMWKVDLFMNFNIFTVAPTLLRSAKDQKALDMDSAKPPSAQQFPPPMDRELGHGHDSDIPRVNARFSQ